MFEAIKRATLLLPSPSSSDPNRKHLFIVLTNPVGPIGQVLLTSVSTAYNGCDESCILMPDDHDWLTRTSYVAYNFCRVEPGSKLVNGIAGNHFEDKGLMQQNVFDRVIQGLQISKHAKPFARHFYNEAQ